MILIDSNIFMYAAGRDHPSKAPCVRCLERVASGGIDAAIDTEVLQEILHRYRAIGAWADGRQVYDHARKIVPVVIPIDVRVLDDARQVLDRYERLTARHAIHAAVTIRHDLEDIVSYDRDFDDVEGVHRIEP